MCFLSLPFYTAYTQTDFFGKSIFLSLLILSMVSWVLIIHKSYWTKHVRTLGRELSLWAKGEKNLLSAAPASGHPFAFIFFSFQESTRELLEKNRLSKKEVFLSSKDLEWITSHVQAKLAEEVKRLEKNVFYLSTTVTLAPFLGLLGTVWGILMTFTHLQVHTLASGNTAVLGGLSLALTTTIIGLVVAIPALIGDKFLRHAIRDVAFEMEHFAEELVLRIELQYRKVDG